SLVSRPPGRQFFLVFKLAPSNLLTHLFIVRAHSHVAAAEGGTHMAIPMQGSWTVSVKAKNADFPQRFIIAGADSGNGTYAGALSTSPVLVTGAHWRIQIQNDPGGGFIDSADQIKFPTVSGGQYRFDIESNDAGGDEDFNDL